MDADLKLRRASILYLIHNFVTDTWSVNQDLIVELLYIVPEVKDLIKNRNFVGTYQKMANWSHAKSEVLPNLCLTKRNPLLCAKTIRER